MKTTFLLAGILAATLSRAGDSAPFLLDTRTGIRPSREMEPLAYSTEWNGAASCSIALDGAPMLSNTTETGIFTWHTDGLPDGLHTLTFNDGVETLDAQFYVNPGRIVFNANGGEETMPDFTLFPGAEQTLPESTFTKDGHFLLGWALAPDGEAMLLDGDSTADIVASPGETVTLYAVWHEGSSSTGGECATGGNANWFVQTSDTHDGIAAARSGAIGDIQSTWLETTVTGSGTISFWWKVSSEGRYDCLRFYVDGNQKDGISGGTPWAQKSFEISSDGEHTITWTYSKDSSVSTGSDCGWVGEVTWPTSDKLHRWVVDSNPPQLDGFNAAYAVRFDANGGDGTMPKRVYAAGEDVTLPAMAFTRDGYAFAGWATAADGAVDLSDKALVTNLTETANATATLYAVWEPHQYSVCFNHGAGTGSMPNQQLTYDVETNLTPNAFARTGYTFAGWATEADGAKVYDDGDAVVNLSSANNAVINLYAIWTANNYTVSFDATGGAVSPGTKTVTFYAAYGELPTPTCDGYVFLDWRLDGLAV